MDGGKIREVVDKIARAGLDLVDKLVARRGVGP
jgi:hypothetical protein